VKFVYLDPSEGVIHCCDQGNKNPPLKKALPLEAVTDVYVGKQTKAFKKKSAKGCADTHCFSISTPAAMLELEAQSALVRDHWVRAVGEMVYGKTKRPIKVHQPDGTVLAQAPQRSTGPRKPSGRAGGQAPEQTKRNEREKGGGPPRERPLSGGSGSSKPQQKQAATSSATLDVPKVRVAIAMCVCVCVCVCV
jgi:hypothetical protein